MIQKESQREFLKELFLTNLWIIDYLQRTHFNLVHF